LPFQNPLIGAIITSGIGAGAAPLATTSKATAPHQSEPVNVHDIATDDPVEAAVAPALLPAAELKSPADRNRDVLPDAEKSTPAAAPAAIMLPLVVDDTVTAGAALEPDAVKTVPYPPEPVKLIAPAVAALVNVALDVTVMVCEPVGGVVSPNTCTNPEVDALL
jgi:hypothetical protein